ncbi:4Fe-4S ferredoxin iron-sulfur binding domain protein [Methanocaldococcus infernus ME]|uniref:4Fe-4S ferredoxin iron-sulfur binding domain protein n=1 Tax=Methanocaldococcus infernus (strain DSM 11812 / JCM 15783 / ME) TaxID=573063 RepID=D5VT71_METIM|nr:ferredoxin family protein [Methanocaldococcus infernus]ADG13774.1 4Fe-4S ferredoxin iron-sulfur binding domain protein [Methanocaldococcus infernus ME]
MAVEIIVNKNKCVGCGICLEACPKGPKIWKKDKDGKYIAYNTEDCHNCKICAGRCPKNAILVRRL